jgi:hypothetical protein
MKRRRTFLTETGLGFTGLALNAMLQSEGVAHAATEGWRPPDGKPHFAPKAKRVIWLFMIGGASQMETFDPKPMLNKYAGKSVNETPFKDVENSPFVKKNLREVIAGLHTVHPTIYPMQIGFKKYGQSGLDVSDWFPHVGGHADKLAVVRSMWTTDNNHGAQLQFHTGRHVLEGQFPTIGAWVHYGLGSLYWASRSIPAAAARGRMGRTIWGRSTTACSCAWMRRTRCRSLRRDRTCSRRSRSASLR